MKNSFLFFFRTFCVALSLLSAGVSVGAENIIANGDFEQQSKRPWTVQFSGDNQKESDLEAELDSTSFRSGKASIRLKGKSAYLSSGPIRVKKNTRYRLSGWIKTFDVPKAEIRLTGKDRNNKPSGVEVSTGVSGTRDWTYNETVFDSGESETVTIQLLLPSRESGAAWFDDIILEEGAKSENANLLRNSTFKACTNDGIPDYWSVNPKASAGTPDWDSGRYYGIDSTQPGPVENARVLRLHKPESSSITLSSNNYLKLLPQGKYTLSVYIKADRNGLAAYCGGKEGKEKKLELSTEWKRYSITSELKGSDCFSLSIENPGTLWISAPQLEEGAQATAFSVSAHDKVKTPDANESQYHEIPSFQCTATESPPVIDGSLSDKCWKDASVISSFKDNETGLPLKTEMQAFCIRDRDNLYIAYRAPLSKSLKIKEGNSSIAESEVFKENSDIAEFFISPNPSSTRYYHFAISASGKSYDAESKNPEWHSGWTVKNGRENDFLIVEASIPLSSLSLKKDQLFCGVNFCMTHYAQGKVEYLAWAGKSSYHKPENFGCMTGLSGKDLEPLFWDIDNIQLKKDAGSYALSAWLSSSSYSEGLFKCVLELPGLIPDFSEEKDFSLENGSSFITFKIPEDILSSAKVLRLKVLSIPGKKTLAYFAQSVSSINSAVSASGGNILAAMLEFSHYTDSAEAVIRLNWKSKKNAGLVIRRTENGRPEAPSIAIAESSLKNPGTSYLAFPIKELPCASYKISAEALQDGKEISSASDTLLKLPPGPVDVNVNKFSRCLFINGLPSICNAFQMQPLEKDMKADTFLSYLKEQGFDTVLQPVPWDIDTEDKSLKDFLGSCAANQIKVILKINSGFRKKTAFAAYREQVLKLIKSLKDNPSVTAWHLIDGLCAGSWEKNKGFKEAELNNLIDAAKEADPLRPLIAEWDKNEFLNSGNAPPYAFSCRADICGIKFYPFPAHPLPEPMRELSRAAQKANEAANPCGRPVIFAVQLFGNGNAAHEPTPEALRFMTFINIIYGTRLCIFDGNGGKPMYDGLQKMQKKLNSEFKYLSENVFSGNSKHLNSGKTANSIHYGLWRNGDTIYLMTANENAKATELSLNLNTVCPFPVSSCVSPFGESGAEIKNGVLTEKIPPLQARLYILK